MDGTAIGLLELLPPVAWTKFSPISSPNADRSPLFQLGDVF
jgi:hypothetical protein